MNTAKITFSLIVLILISTVNCMTVRPFDWMAVQPLAYESTEREPKPTDYPIEILDSDNIDKEYKVIGEISIVAHLLTPSSKMKFALLNKTREMGGDAIIDFNSNFSSEQDEHGYNQVNSTIWTSKVIVWL